MITDADLAALTEDELAMMERDYARATERDTPLILARGVAAYIPALIAEVRRLRRVLADLASFDAEVFRLMGHEADLPTPPQEER